MKGNTEESVQGFTDNDDAKEVYRWNTRHGKFGMVAALIEQANKLHREEEEDQLKQEVHELISIVKAMGCTNANGEQLFCETFISLLYWLTHDSLLNYCKPHPRTPSLVSASCFHVPEISSWHPLRLPGFHLNWFIASC